MERGQEEDESTKRTKLEQDVVVHVLGDAFCDIVAHGLNSLPIWGEAAYSQGIAQHAGGSALNTAVHTSSLLNNQNVTLFTALGEDNQDWASIVLEKHLQRFGVKLVAKRTKMCSTGVCIVLTETDDRAFITSAGAIQNFNKKDIDIKTISACSHLHIGGLYVLHSLQTDLATLLKEIRIQNPHITISLDSNFDSKEIWGFPWMVPVLSCVDIVKFNEEEAKGVHIKNAITKEEKDMNEVSWLASKVRLLAVVTRGKEGAWYALNENPTEVFSVNTPQLEKIVDSVGAGDAFNAGFIVSYFVKKQPLKEAMTFACACGALATQYVAACQTPVTEQEVRKLLLKDFKL